MRAAFTVCNRVFAIGLPIVALVAACGGASEPPASPADESAAAPADNAEAPVEAKSEPAPKAEEASAAAEESAPAPDRPAEASEETTGRDVKYVATSDGLRIDVAGMRFMANATAVQAAGGWGVKVSVEAQAVDSKAHSVLSPKNGPLAFGGAVQRKGQSEAEQFGDKREGDTDVKVAPGKITTFKRDWPAKGTKPLANGDILELQVGLWGIGEDKDARRPVKQFFRVKLNADKPKPRAIVEPPPSAGEG